MCYNKRTSTSRFESVPYSEPAIELPRPVIVSIGALGVGKAAKDITLYEVDVRPQILPEEPEAVVGFLKRQIGHKNAAILEPLIFNNEQWYENRQLAEMAGIKGEKTRIENHFRRATDRLMGTPYSRHLTTVNRQDEGQQPNISIWRTPRALVAPEPIDPRDVFTMVKANILERGQFPLIPFDPTHRRMVKRALELGGKDFTNRGNGAQTRSYGIQLGFGLINNS